jgi:prephenate dehydrogenase
MAKATITIIGLGKTGSSIGLALKKPELDYQVLGHDKDRSVANKAKEMGAVDSISWNLINACEGADVVILAIPFDQVEETLQAVGPELRPNCVVVDTSFFKQPTIAWAEAHLGKDVHFVGIFLGTNPEYALDTTKGPAGARADLFANSPCSLMPSPACRPEAVKATQDLAALLGATPHFMDPAEFDGLSTAVNLLPGLMAGALMRPVSDTASWREMRRLTSGALALFSSPLESGGASLAQSAIQNRETVLHWLDIILEELQTMRAQVSQEQREALANQLEATIEIRDKWMADWQRNRWDKVAATEMPTMGSFFGQLLGFGGRRRTDRSEEQ